MEDTSEDRTVVVLFANASERDSELEIADVPDANVDGVFQAAPEDEESCSIL